PRPVADGRLPGTRVRVPGPGEAPGNFPAFGRGGTRTGSSPGRRSRATACLRGARWGVAGPAPLNPLVCPEWSPGCRLCRTRGTRASGGAGGGVDDLLGDARGAGHEDPAVGVADDVPGPLVEVAQRVVGRLLGQRQDDDVILLLAGQAHHLGAVGCLEVVDL